MSGTYDLLRFFGTQEYTEEYFVSSPLLFVPTLDGIHLHELEAIEEQYAELERLFADGVV